MNDVEPERAKPEARYGRPPRKRTWLVIAVYAVGVVLTIAFLAWAAFVRFGEPVSWEVRTFDVVSDEAVDIAFEVRRDDGAEVACLLAAQAHDHSVVGETVVTIPAGEETVRVTHTVETQGLAVIATVESCDPAD